MLSEGGHSRQEPIGETAKVSGGGHPKRLRDRLSIKTSDQHSSSAKCAPHRTDSFTGGECGLRVNVHEPGKIFAGWVSPAESSMELILLQQRAEK